MRWVGFVRNVMLGRDGLDRGRLLDLTTSAGGTSPVSYLTTGNVAFDASRHDIDDVARRLRQGLEAVVGRRTMVAVRSRDWLRELVGTEPFAGFADGEWEPEVVFLPRSAPPLDGRRLPRPGRTRVVAVLERELVTARPRTGPDRPHGNRLVEAASGAEATARGWSTLCRIVARERER